jgi:methylenetetrahydrofolate reductase (NADPH)
MPVPDVSFEFFPPRTLPASFRLWEAAKTLAPLGPRWVSVTYGAGGTTRVLTREAVAALAKGFDFRVAGHLTCVEASREETLEVARGYRKAGVKDIVALRGDPPKGAEGFVPRPDGFRDSVELVGALAAEGFRVRVGAYPDTHPEAADGAADIAWLRAKIEAGAREAVTQFFFDPDTYLRFRDACAGAGIAVPVVPGLLPVEDWAKTRRFAEGCGARVPDAVAARYEGAGADHDRVAVDHAVEMSERLMAEGVGHLHFYTLNKPDLTRDVCMRLGLLENVAAGMALAGAA